MNTILGYLMIGVAILVGVLVTAANLLKDHPSCQPDDEIEEGLRG